MEISRLSGFGLLWALACASQSTESASARRASVVLSPEGAKSTRVWVEVVSSDEERARGLMFREHLDSDAGMLFIFETSADHAFWMKNTKIPLDMIFISEAMRVVGLVEGAEPLSKEPLSVGVPSRYVLEVNAGIAAQRGIVVGTGVAFEGVK